MRPSWILPTISMVWGEERCCEPIWQSLPYFFWASTSQVAFLGVVGAGLLDVDVLAGLEAEDGHGGVPVVGRGDGDDVDVFGGEDLAEVLLRTWEPRP